MLIVRELLINTGTMTFESNMDFDNFIVSTPSLKKIRDLLGQAEQNGYMIDRLLVREESNVFRLKTTYHNEVDSRFVQEQAQPYTENIQLVVEGLGWTAEKFVSYVYD